MVVISHRVDARRQITDADRMEALWLGMQTELAGRSRRGVLVMADTEDHYIHLRQPELVVEGIRFVIQSSHAVH